ncbi:MAG: peptidoglycan recognition family protein [Mycobacteriales bacterium]
MKFHTNLAAVARATGFPVTEVAGWQSRGKDFMGRHSGMVDRPTGVVCHHTATTTPTGDYPSLRTVTNGRKGLINALANFGLGRSGRIYVVAAGQAWHAGPVNDDRCSNPQAFGIEAENSGRGERWGAAMLESYARLCAEICRAFNISPSLVRAHREVRIPLGAKIDPTGIDMNAFRRTVADRLAHKSTQEDVTIVDQATKDFFKKMEDRLNQRLGALDANSRARLSAIEAALAADPSKPVTQDQLDKAVAAGLADMHITLGADTPAKVG